MRIPVLEITSERRLVNRLRESDYQALEALVPEGPSDACAFVHVQGKIGTRVDYFSETVWLEPRDFRRKPPAWYWRVVLPNMNYAFPYEPDEQDYEPRYRTNLFLSRSYLSNWTDGDPNIAQLVLELRAFLEAEVPALACNLRLLLSPQD